MNFEVYFVFRVLNQREACCGGASVALGTQWRHHEGRQTALLWSISY